MQIKIPTYPKKKVTDIFWAGHETDSVVNYDENGNPTSSSQTVSVNLNTGEVVKTIYVESKGVKYSAPFPNPVHLFVSQAVEHYEASQAIKIEEFPKLVNEVDKEHSYLKVDLHETSDALNSYIQHRSGCIITLITAIESFLNHITPNQFIFIKGNKNLSKEDIQRWMSLKDKLWKLIPQLKRNKDFWKGNESIAQTIIELYNHRNNIIHLKTTTDPQFQQYLNSIEKMLQFDLNNAIKSTIDFMNLVQPGFIEYVE